MRAKLSSERGASLLEFAVVLPILALILTVIVPVVVAGWEYMVMNRAAAHGVRYATRVDPNARCDGSVDASGLCSGTLRRRPTPAEVETFVRDAAGSIQLGSVEVDPDPSTAISGEIVRVAVTHEVSFGPLAQAANALVQTIGGGQLLPASTVLTVTAEGREE